MPGFRVTFSAVAGASGAGPFLSEYVHPDRTNRGDLNEGFTVVSWGAGRVGLPMILRIVRLLEVGWLAVALGSCERATAGYHGDVGASAAISVAHGGLAGALSGASSGSQPSDAEPASSALAPLPAWIQDDMVPVSGGTFEMGSADPDANENEKPVHRVTVSRFLLDRTEVTVAAYAACVQAGACSEPDAYADRRGDRHSFCNWQYPEERSRHPVNCVDYIQATGFCRWAGKRLPTEEEWEFAARAGDEERTFPWGNGKPDETRLNACGVECPANARAKGLAGWPPMYPSSDGWPETAPVGTFPRGAARCGALDLAGNVWEWTESLYQSYDGKRTEQKRVLRGGSWGGSDPRTERTTNRFALDPSSRAQFLGFRCAK